MKRIILVVTMLAISASGAYAKCTNKTIFACTTTNGKLVEVCDNGDAIEYVFGKSLAKPEKHFKVDRNKATTYQWNGMGRSMSYSVEIPTGDTVYSVYTSADKIDVSTETGLSVSVKGKNVATLKCNEKKKMIVDIEGIDLKPGE